MKCIVVRDKNGDLIVDGKKMLNTNKDLWHTKGDKIDWEWKRMSEKWRSWGYTIIDEYKRV